MSRVRTNIEIEDPYLQAIMDRYGVRTKTEAGDSRCDTWPDNR